MTGAACQCGDWKAPPCPIVIGSVALLRSSISNRGAIPGERPPSPVRSMLSSSQRMAMRVQRREMLGWPILVSLALHLTLFLSFLMMPAAPPPTSASEPLTVDFVVGEGPAEATSEPPAAPEATAAPIAPPTPDVPPPTPVQQAEIPPPTPAPVPPPPPVQQAEIPPPTPAPAPDVPPPPPVQQAETPPPTPAPAPMPVPPPPPPVAQVHPQRAPPTACRRPRSGQPGGGACARAGRAECCWRRERCEQWRRLDGEAEAVVGPARRLS